ncbi:tetratricopeptide repeat protein [Algivirga pacifica]|uniref:Tetratricopeptide repeat-containing protein n=1 Tax=Algivirga pacifica TaxID=1162670 RepID=A0ABP9D7E1_9BACT
MNLKKAFLLIACSLSFNVLIAQDFNTNYQQGKAAFQSGNYKNAIKLLQDARMMGSDQSNTPEFFETLNYLAQSYEKLKRYNNAYTYYTSLSTKLTQTGNDRTAPYAELQVNMGEVLMNMRRYEEAAKIFTAALPIIEGTKGIKSPLYITALQNASMIYSRMQVYDMALSHYEKLIPLSKEVYKGAGEQYAKVLLEATNLYVHIKKQEQALAYSNEAIEVLSKASLNGWLSMAYQQRALIYEHLKNQEQMTQDLKSYVEHSADNIAKEQKALQYSIHKLEAIKGYDAIYDFQLIELELLKKAHGEESEEIAKQYEHIAKNLIKGNRQEEAITFYQKGLLIYKESSLPHMQTLMEIADLSAAIDNIPQAEEYYQKATNMMEKHLSVSHPAYLEGVTKLVRLYTDTQQYEKAKPLHKVATDGVMKSLGKDHGLYAENLACSAWFKLQEEGTEEEAYQLLEQASKMKKRFYGSYSLEYALSVKELGDAKRKKKASEALAHYKQAKILMNSAKASTHKAVKVIDEQIEQLSAQ